MTIPQYTGEPAQRPATAPPWPVAQTRREKMLDPRGYQPDAGLINAVNVALLLEQPLLLTGEPGTGKTQLAYSLAYELGLQPPLTYETKSASTARDLFYSYDAVGHFRAGQATQGGDVAALDFITWNALGEAILRSRRIVDVEHLLPGYAHSGVCRSVVLIDEIDKAPRDFPNDLLNEVEQLFFKVPEYRNVRIDAQPDLRPLLVLTSNSEKNLPDAFLRRCAYYHIGFPDDAALKKIVQQRCDFAGSDGPLLQEALRLFGALRDEKKRHWDKRPATAELLGWLSVLHQRGADFTRPLREQTDKLQQSLAALVKSPGDQDYVTQMVKKNDW